MKKTLKFLYNRYCMILERARISIMKFRGARLGIGIRVYGPVAHCGSYSNLSAGESSTFNHGIFLNLSDKITIGSHVHLSPYVQIHTGSLEIETLPRIHWTAPVIIEDHVWVASGAIICAGVLIGEGSVVAAGSVVTKEVPKNSMVAGSPAKFVRKLELKEYK